MHRHFELDAGARRPVAPVLDVMGEALLPRIEIDGRDPLPGIHQGDRDMHRGGRFARAAFLVAEHDDVRGRGPSRDRLHQHRRHPQCGDSLFAYRLVKVRVAAAGLMINYRVAPHSLAC